MNLPTSKYIAIKPRNLNHWLWFETSKVTRENGIFIGLEGWGKNGNPTNIKLNESDINGEITSNVLQY